MKITEEDRWSYHTYKTPAGHKINVALCLADLAQCVQFPVGFNRCTFLRVLQLLRARFLQICLWNAWPVQLRSLIANFGLFLQSTAWLRRLMYMTTAFERYTRCRNITEWRHIKGEHNTWKLMGFMTGSRKNDLAAGKTTARNVSTWFHCICKRQLKQYRTRFVGIILQLLPNKFDRAHIFWCVSFGIVTKLMNIACKGV